MPRHSRRVVAFPMKVMLASWVPVALPEGWVRRLPRGREGGAEEAVGWDFRSGLREVGERVR